MSQRGRASTALTAAPGTVASLKPVELTPGNYNANPGTARNGQVTMTNVTLSDCLRFAYSITNDAQIAGPETVIETLVTPDYFHRTGVFRTIEARRI